MLKWLLLTLLTLPVFANVTFEHVPRYATPNEQMKIQRAAVKMNQTIASQCFADFMLKQNMNSTNGRTAQQVVDHLRSLSGTIPVKMYTNIFSSAVAYRNVKSRIINLNRKAFKLSGSDCHWAGTMAHEGVGHVLGNYGHSFEWTRQREDTVTYLLSGRKERYGGDVFSKCCL